jgi:hypothetical protein
MRCFVGFFAPPTQPRVPPYGLEWRAQQRSRSHVYSYCGLPETLLFVKCAVGTLRLDAKDMLADSVRWLLRQFYIFLVSLVSVEYVTFAYSMSTLVHADCGVRCRLLNSVNGQCIRACDRHTTRPTSSLWPSIRCFSCAQNEDCVQDKTRRLRTSNGWHS